MFEDAHSFLAIPFQFAPLGCCGIVAKTLIDCPNKLRNESKRGNSPHTHVAGGKEGMWECRNVVHSSLLEFPRPEMSTLFIVQVFRKPRNASAPK